MLSLQQRSSLMKHRIPLFASRWCLGSLMTLLLQRTAVQAERKQMRDHLLFMHKDNENETMLEFRTLLLSHHEHGASANMFYLVSITIMPSARCCGNRLWLFSVISCQSDGVGVTAFFLFFCL